MPSLLLFDKIPAMTHIQEEKILKRASQDTDLLRIYNIWAEKVSWTEGEK